MKTIVEKFLKCPVCGFGMFVSDDGKSVYCLGERKHCFDFSSEGYLSLNPRGSGDTKESVKSRKAFLEKNYFQTAARKIADMVGLYVKDCNFLVDAGCGEGYYTNLLSDLSEYTFGVDLSKYACGYAAKKARADKKQNLLYATSSVFDLPLMSGRCDCIVNIFAPCAEEEFCRVLDRGGVLVVAGAGKNHLLGLKEVIYENPYVNTERADLPKNMLLIEKVNLSYDICLRDNADIIDLFSMTPYYWRTSEKDKTKLDKLEKLNTAVEFEICIYKKQT